MGLFNALHWVKRENIYILTSGSFHWKNKLDECCLVNIGLNPSRFTSIFLMLFFVALALVERRLAEVKQN